MNCFLEKTKRAVEFPALAHTGKVWYTESVNRNTRKILDLDTSSLCAPEIEK